MLNKKDFDKMATEVAKTISGMTLKNKERNIEAVILDCETFTSEKNKKKYPKRYKEILLPASSGTVLILPYRVVNLLFIRTKDGGCILVRSISIESKRITGPGRVTEALKITPEMNGSKLFDPQSSLQLT